MTNKDITFLTKLESIIEQRLADGPEDSYTARLVASGDNRVAQKVGEEAVELALASVSGGREEQVEEAADLMYHLLVLLSSKGIQLADIAATLCERHEQ